MAHEASEIFKALSVSSRIHIVSLLKHHGPMPVKDIYEVNIGAMHDCCGHLIQVCACPSCDTPAQEDREGTVEERLLYKREQLLAELQRIEGELEKLR